VPSRLAPLDFERLDGLSDDDCLAAFRCFERSARAFVEGRQSPRPARAPSRRLIGAAHAALRAEVGDAAGAREFFSRCFRPFRVAPDGEAEGFLTGYYEPFIAASRVETKDFSWPILARPSDLVSLGPGEAPAALPPGFTAARRLKDGSLVPYEEREAIERMRRGAIVWLRDAVEAFLVQVQGSAQAQFPDGSRARLAYDGRNGHPYASIGRLLIESGEIAEGAMSLAALKAWLRGAGLLEGERGLNLMRRNRSFVFFRLLEDFDPNIGPVAGAGVALTPLRSIAVDRALWSYGLPFFIEAEMPWTDHSPQPFRQLMVAQDTGSAIVGPARADIFFGCGDVAGERAGAIRHSGAFTVLLPHGDGP